MPHKFMCQVDVEVLIFAIFVFKFKNQGGDYGEKDQGVNSKTRP